MKSPHTRAKNEAREILSYFRLVYFPNELLVLTTI